MQLYFNAQYLRLIRKLRALGFHPLIALVGGFFLIGFLVKYVYWKSAHAGIILLVFSLLLQSKLNDPNKLLFKKYCFNNADYFRIKIVEQLLCTLPIILILIIFGDIQLIPFTLIGGLFLAAIDQNIINTRQLPSPFFHRPFEYSRGFRKYLAAHLFSLFLLTMGLLVDNYNLAYASIILLIFIIISFYYVPEPVSYVSIYNRNSTSFLHHKLKVGIFYGSCLIGPSIIILSVFYVENIIWILLLLPLMVLYISNMICAKYSCYPANLHLPIELLLITSFLIPPIQLMTIPFFYQKSKRQLNSIL